MRVKFLGFSNNDEFVIKSLKTYIENQDMYFLFKRNVEDKIFSSLVCQFEIVHSTSFHNPGCVTNKTERRTKDGQTVLCIL